MTSTVAAMLSIRDRCESEGRRAAAGGTLSHDNPYSARRQPEEFSAWREGWYGRCGADRHPRIADVPAAWKRPAKSKPHPAQRAHS